MRLNTSAIAVFAVVATVSGFLATVVLPAAELAPRVPAQRVVLTQQQEMGRAIYVQENCMACHTQQVRTIESGFGMVREPLDIGEAADPAGYAGQNPALLGGRRLGPDLLRVGTRIDQADEMIALLREPSQRTPGARMPSYRHLSEAELRALAMYLLSLK